MQQERSYPLPAYLKFCPGGITYHGAVPEDFYRLAEYTGTNKSNTRSGRNTPTSSLPSPRTLLPDILLSKAKQADLRLRQYAVLSDPSSTTPLFLPSLSVLAEQCFGRFTGCPSTAAKGWADAMILHYFESSLDDIAITSEEDIYSTKPIATQTLTGTNTAAALLRKLHEDAQSAQTSDSMVGRPRPCGYVFKRGDIAWNCRTCQTDATCVICDSCFRQSDHHGHEVYFHRTSPGGCCDCGDAEAWKSEGCCDKHRPVSQVGKEGPSTELDPMEAVMMSLKGLKDGIDTVSSHPATKLPPRLAAALGVVVGAIVNSIVDAVDGAAAGADPVQWKRRWAHEAASIYNGVPNNEQYYLAGRYEFEVPATFAADPVESLPESFDVQLRLHNDDVHTFDEVIEALHGDTRMRRRMADPDSILVPARENATEMTHHVDADGQVTVKVYSSITDALNGFKRLKASGLHCAVVSNVQVQMELRARVLISWLSEICAAHPAAAALVVHALVQVDPSHDLGGVQVWPAARMIPPWVVFDQVDELQSCRRRFSAFPPHLVSSYLTREECELMHGIALEINATSFVSLTGTDPSFYAKVPYRLPSEKYRKSPHSLWGTVPSHYSDPVNLDSKHPLLRRLVTGRFDAETASLPNRLTESVFVVDTDLRKQQNPKILTSSLYTHKLPGLHMISGIGAMRIDDISVRRPPLPYPMHLRHLLGISSFRAPVSPILLALLFDPYPTKQLRGSLHVLFLSLLTDSRFKSRFAGALGVAYRPLSTLFCAGVGTEADSPLHFSVQIFTAGSLVRALCHRHATEKLLLSDQPDESLSPEHTNQYESSIGVFVPPISHVIVRCIHTNLLGATQEISMILKNTTSGNDDNSVEPFNPIANDNLLPALTYVAGEHPLLTPLPAAHDDGFLDSRSTRHKRLPHILRDLEYVIETPGTALRLLLPHRFSTGHGPSLSLRGEDILPFASIFARMLRLAQGMDTQKRKISGGHVEYEQNRWLEAFGLSLNFAGTRDALAESSSCSVEPSSDDVSHLQAVREAIGSVFAALLRELKLWLYRESLLETGLPVSPSQGIDISQVTSLQRSTLHVSSSEYSDYNDSTALDATPHPTRPVNTVALSCATGIKMTEAQLILIENSLKVAASQQTPHTPDDSSTSQTGPLITDWLRVPHSPLGGDALSFHLPLHRALAKCIRSMCSVVVPLSYRDSFPSTWWHLPVLDDSQSPSVQLNDQSSFPHHPLVPVLRSTLRSGNCRVNWSSGPDCTPQEAQRRRTRSRAVSVNIAVAKVIHSLVDHPLRCLAAAQQVERHLWTRNGASVAGMAMNYSNTPLCRSFRDLDLLLVQLSAAGMSCGLGSRRTFSLILSRFSMDGYLCDPERRSAAGASGNSFVLQPSTWVNPPRLQDPDHAVILAESFFSTICVLVTELPPPPPDAVSDNVSLRQSIRRELVHALLAEPRSHSAAMAAASGGISRREESDGNSGSNGGASMFSESFASVLEEVGIQKTRSGSRSSSGPPVFELKAACCDEYDPTYYHLKRQEHQHAMDVVERLRKQKLGNDKSKADSTSLPLVCPPPKAHPRFLPCRLVLHLDLMDAAIRRSLLFALTNGSWLPPSEPTSLVDTSSDKALSDEGEVDVSVMVTGSPSGADVPMTAFNRRTLQSQASGASFSISRRENETTLFSKEVVAASSVSFLELLQLLTLQIHTLEECASLHRVLSNLDDESRLLSSSLSINSYLGRLIHVPTSLADVWALRPHPHGPLQSKGSGEKRGSILGLLIALYEHRSDHGAILDSEGGDQTDEGHGGARALASSALKWILRFVNALVDGAPAVSAAIRSATSGVREIKPQTDSSASSWTIDREVRSVITRMLANLTDLWPVDRRKSESSEKSTPKVSEAGKAAQQRQLEKMRKMQAKFAATIQGIDDQKNVNERDTGSDQCIICRCDDADGENNGPLGFLGHVQRSRVVQMRASSEAYKRKGAPLDLSQSYLVVGHKGCQLRETEAMDSRPLSCLPKGSIVTLISDKVSMEYGVLSRRVFVRHKPESNMHEGVSEGWASIQSSQGYVILTPLISMCFTNSRWGGTRPVIKQCGHAAHLRCVETHTLSLHHRAASEQTYDGRFAANIDDGEFLCPLCKQLCNILIPRDKNIDGDIGKGMDVDETGPSGKGGLSAVRTSIKTGCSVYLTAEERDSMTSKALDQFGSKLYSAMNVPWDRATNSQRKHQQEWNRAIQMWDFEDVSLADGSVKNTLGLLRQQLISWSAVGHNASALEASTRAVEEVLPFGTFSVTSDPWQGFNATSRYSHPMLLELRRMLSASSGLLQLLCRYISDQLSSNDNTRQATIIGECLANILDGRSWVDDILSCDKSSETDAALWSCLYSLVSALPCHVSRDGTIAQRCEARATAAAMWTMKGIGRSQDERGDVPTPFAIQQLPRGQTCSSGWGTMDPCSLPTQTFAQPFRPGIAGVFLYLPLLSWDLNTYSASILSALLGNPVKALPSGQQILAVCKALVLGRLVQAIVTPCGFDLLDESDLDEETCWDKIEVQKEGDALSILVAHCRSVIERKSMTHGQLILGDSSTYQGKVVLAGLGRALLPFSRSLILMLRAFVSTVHDRQQRSGQQVGRNEFDEIMDNLLCNDDLMTVEDGFHFIKAMDGPLPTQAIDTSTEWWALINRWLVATLGLECHHGSRGKIIGCSTEGIASSELNNSVSRQHIAQQHQGTAVNPVDVNEASGDASNLAPAYNRNDSMDQDDSDAEISEVADHGNFFGLRREMLHDSVDDDEEDDDEDVMMQDVEEFTDLPGMIPTFTFLNPALNGNTGGEDSSEEYSSSDTEGDLGDREFAQVSRSPILYYQSSLLGRERVGPGKSGDAFESGRASCVMSDLSHLSLVHLRGVPTFSLVRLPKSFVELYNMVNVVKGSGEESPGMDDNEDLANSETAICLLTGAVMRSGSPRRTFARAARQPGSCTIHARKTGSGIGIFFLVQKCTVLLMHNNKSAYSPSLYVDVHGEEDPGLKRGRPLFLQEDRYRALERLWRQQGIPGEVAQIRSTSDRVIRDNWY